MALCLDALGFIFVPSNATCPSFTSFAARHSRSTCTNSPDNAGRCAFKEAGVIERYGSGIGRIITDFKEYGLAAPEFEEVGNHFLVTVYKERVSGLVQIPGKGVVEKVPKVDAATQKGSRTGFRKSNQKSDGKSNEKSNEKLWAHGMKVCISSNSRRLLANCYNKDIVRGVMCVALK